MIMLTCSDPVDGEYHRTSDRETIAKMLEALAADIRDGQCHEIDGALMLFEDGGIPVRWAFSAN